MKNFPQPKVSYTAPQIDERLRKLDRLIEENKEILTVDDIPKSALEVIPEPTPDGSEPTSPVYQLKVGGEDITEDLIDFIQSELDVGEVNGIASLDEHGHVPSTQLPSYVDDVIEGYAKKETIDLKDEAGDVVMTEVCVTEFHTVDDPNKQSLETLIAAESGKIYLDLNTLTTYRWSGSLYAQISESLALGETATTAFYGDKGKEAHDLAKAAMPKSGGIFSGNPILANNIYLRGTSTPGAAWNLLTVDDSNNVVFGDANMNGNTYIAIKRTMRPSTDIGAASGVDLGAAASGTPATGPFRNLYLSGKLYGADGTNGISLAGGTINLPNNIAIKALDSNNTSQEIIRVNASNEMVLGASGVWTNIVTYQSIVPATVETDKLSIGAADRKFKNIYISGNLSNGTDSVKVADIINKDTFNALAAEVAYINTEKNETVVDPNLEHLLQGDYTFEDTDGTTNLKIDSQGIHTKSIEIDGITLKFETWELTIEQEDGTLKTVEKVVCVG